MVVYTQVSRVLKYRQPDNSMHPQGHSQSKHAHLGASLLWTGAAPTPAPLHWPISYRGEHLGKNKTRMPGAQNVTGNRTVVSSLGEHPFRSYVIYLILTLLRNQGRKEKKRGSPALTVTVSGKSFSDPGATFCCCHCCQKVRSHFLGHSA